MYILDIIKELKKASIRYGNVDYCPISKIEKVLEDLSKSCVQWSVEDFASMAEQKKGIDWKDWYDENEFEYALYEMIRKHDAEHGISWDTVKYYLDEFCWKKKPPIK
jgi:hypothetical protein